MLSDDKTSVEDFINELGKLDCEDSQFDTHCTNIADEIVLKKATIHNVVENLGPLLTDTKHDVRAKGTFVLSSVLESLPSDFLTTTELNFITSFYVDRLKDHHDVIPPVLKGILAVVKSQKLDDGEVSKLLSALFANVACQQQHLEDRKRIYRILEASCDGKLPEIQKMGLDFILGMISVIDGERDPRNLLMIFKWFPTIVPKLSLEHLLEDVFDVVSCYFPIDFQSDPDDQTTSRNNLAMALLPCLYAVQGFDKQCMELILEKLSSSVVLAQRDALMLLNRTCLTFRPEIYKENWKNLYPLLQNEILNNSDGAVVFESQQAIKNVLQKISEIDTKIVRNIIDEMYNTLKLNFKDDKKLFPSVQILVTAANATPESSCYLAQKIIPNLIYEYHMSMELTKKERLFGKVVEFVSAYARLNFCNDISKVCFLEEIPKFFAHHLCSDFEIQVRGLTILQSLAPYLPLSTKAEIFRALKNGTVHDTTVELRTNFLECFKTYCIEYRNEIFEEIKKVEFTYDTLHVYLESLASIVLIERFTEFVLKKFVDMATNIDIAKSTIAIKSLRQLTQENNYNFVVIDLQTRHNLIDKLMASMMTNIKIYNRNTFENVAAILKIIIRNMDSGAQKKIMKNYLDDLLKLYNDDPALNYDVVILLEGLLSALRTNVSIPNKYTLIKDLACKDSNIPISSYFHLCKLVGNIINKSSEFDIDYVHALDQCATYIDSESVVLEDINKRMALAIWIMKAMVMKDSQFTDHWIEKFTLLLDNKNKYIADNVSIIVSYDCDCLTAKNYCTVKMLYRQRFYVYFLEKMSLYYKHSKPNYLIALGNLFRFMPSDVIALHFKEAVKSYKWQTVQTNSSNLKLEAEFVQPILPRIITLYLLLFCLERCEDRHALCTTLQTLLMLLETKKSNLEPYLEELLWRFLKLSTYEPSLKVRILALKCLREMCIDYPRHILLPHKPKVWSLLALCLDDKKRLVRRQAVLARVAWYVLEVPG